ncbi:RNA-processing protein [archaeon]|nr:RNA-processing protein [archaeon]
MEQSEFVRIPMERIGALIGPKGSIKKELEKKLKVRLLIDSESGDVEVKGTGHDAVNAFTAGVIVKAIGRGFSWEKASKLAIEGIIFELIDLRELFGKKKEKKIMQKKARIIGSKGKAREIIEQETGAFVSVYGHTVGLIGSDEAVGKARKVIDALLEGKRHSTAFKMLEAKEEEEWEL